MYLPVVLYREYGIGGWIIFAVPNVIGAAAMAWVLRDRQASQRMISHHRAAMVVFFIVTIAFQCYFLGWLINLLPPSSAVVAGGVLLLMFTIGLRGDNALTANGRGRLAAFLRRAGLVARGWTAA